MPKEEEYELVPISPLRRLEKRIEKLEASVGSEPKEFYKEIVDIIRINQQIVDELVKANSTLRIELSRLPSKLDQLVSKLDELLTYIKASAEAEVEVTKPTFDVETLVKKIDELIASNRKISSDLQNVLKGLEEVGKRFRPLPIRKPLIPPKPKI
jgi:chromosome segregation ATPase